VLDGEPDLVMSYGYNPEAGFTAERLEEQGINNFTWTESCDDYDGEDAIGAFFDDVRLIGDIFDVGDRAEDLIADWQERIDGIAENAPDEPVRVLNTGSGDPTAPFASGGLGVGHEIIELAGGENIFEDVDSTWFEPTWEEVVDRDPELIVEHSGLELDDVRDHLSGNPGLSVMTAVEEDNYAAMRYQESVAGPQLFEGLEIMAAAILDVRS
jgi:iron complex transport system substrate-binding protein